MTAIRIGKMLVDMDNAHVSVDGSPIQLTNREFMILERLVLSQGRVTTRVVIMNHLYRGIVEPKPKIIDVYVCHLRKKIAAATGGEDYIESVFGEGYRLQVGSETWPQPCATS